ncbi:hypothetical protein HDV05_006209 [Chytridiales sp. JEL 0842]|nr:hypothetical protein HDV05_006209 [Chytridiales sp. JEL 0842]
MRIYTQNSATPANNLEYESLSPVRSLRGLAQRPGSACSTSTSVGSLSANTPQNASTPSNAASSSTARPVPGVVKRRSSGHSRKSLSRSYYSSESGGGFMGSSGNVRDDDGLTLSSAAIRQQTIEFSYREFSFQTGRGSGVLRKESNESLGASSTSSSLWGMSQRSPEVKMPRPTSPNHISQLSALKLSTATFESFQASERNEHGQELADSESPKFQGNNSLPIPAKDFLNVSPSQSYQDKTTSPLFLSSFLHANRSPSRVDPVSHRRQSPLRTLAAAVYTTDADIESRDDLNDENSDEVAGNTRGRESDSRHSKLRQRLPTTFSSNVDLEEDVTAVNESAPLLGNERSSSPSSSKARENVNSFFENFKAFFAQQDPLKNSDSVGALLLGCLFAGLSSIPAVILGLILNLLDALSYGIIIFPTSNELFPASATQAGISMFLASTIIAQVVFAMGGSGFKGANGSMMIEVMPFLYVMVNLIQEQTASESTESVLATVMVAYAMSTILTGIVFLLLGVFKLGNLIQFFPRHILVGCIGGIGWFLFVTGIEVTCGVEPELSLEFIKNIFEWENAFLWGSSLLIALFLKMLQRRITHPLFVPLFYVAIPIVFYLVVFIFGVQMETLRKLGLLFRLPPGEQAPFWTFWTYFNGMRDIHWYAIPSTLGTQLALIFFAVLHVPINVPALAVSTHQAVDVNREMIGHGVGNILAGLCGTPQNYLVYSNSVLYIRSGGNTTIGSFMLAGATAVIWIAGGNVIGFVPILVVGSLIFHLAFDLMKESIWDTWSVGISSWEYFTIVMIVFIMAFFGFTEGILAGMVLACFFFVVMYSRKSIIRSLHTGLDVRSTVHRPYRQRIFLDSVGEQIRVVKMKGFLFFGTISQLESYVDHLLVKTSLVRFLILEFSMISGVDYSALEAFHRLKRQLSEKDIHLVFCEVGVIGRELAKSGLFDSDQIHNDEELVHIRTPETSYGELDLEAHDERTHDTTHTHTSTELMVHNFKTLNQALEYAENCLLASLFQVKSSWIDRGTLPPPQVLSSAEVIPIQDVRSTKISPEDRGLVYESFVDPEDTPRMTQIKRHAFNILQSDYQNHKSWMERQHVGSSYFASEEHHPVYQILCASMDDGITDTTLCANDLVEICKKFEHVEVQKGTVLWVQGQTPSQLYLVESGELSQVAIEHKKSKIVETLMPGTMVGELELFSSRPHSYRLVASEKATLWKLSKDAFNQLSAENPPLALAFVRVSLTFDCMRVAIAPGGHDS